jgi:hypothetical protein
LERGSHFLSRPVWTMILLFYTSLCIWDNRSIPPHPAVGWDGVSQTLFQGWFLTQILPISAFQVARIADIKHLYPA